MRTPVFWHAGKGGLLKMALTPVGWIYRLAARLARRKKGGRAYKPNIPVICVGNLVAGGQGKTPVVDDFLRRISARGLDVHALSRGYGGALKGPVRIDPKRHEASRAGDEPLLLCRTAPVWIAGNRAAGARVAIEHGAEVLVMDDGFQNAMIDKTASVIVIDGGFGFGNGATIPAGPLREPISDGLDRADAVVIIGPDDHDVEAAVRSRAPGLRILKARVRPTEGAATIEGKNVFAFAGIGRPEKFYRTLEELGCDIRARRNFGDHHPYGRADIQPILDRAKDLGAIPVTTAKDFIRVPGDRRGEIVALHIELAWENEQEVNAFIREVLDHGRPRAGT